MDDHLGCYSDPLSLLNRIQLMRDAKTSAPETRFTQMSVIFGDSVILVRVETLVDAKTRRRNCALMAVPARSYDRVAPNLSIGRAGPNGSNPATTATTEKVKSRKVSGQTKTVL